MPVLMRLHRDSRLAERFSIGPSKTVWGSLCGLCGSSDQRERVRASFFMNKFLKTIFSLNSFSLTICTTLLVLILYLVSVPILDLIELKTYDLRFLSRGGLKPSPDVVLAVIDEKSLNELGRWPWPRSIMARLIEKLSEEGAKVVGLDVGFLEPEKADPLKTG